jgi:NAD(P)-dependent dehydrogenase (short-subunit alcohol dehydrogenase family)
VSGRLADRVVVVTGGAAGLGLACVERLGREGARVVIADLDEPAARTSAAATGAEAYGLDVSDAAAVAALFGHVDATYGRLDGLVTSAAITDPAHQARDGAAAEADPEVWERTLSVDLVGTMLCCKYAVPLMQRAGTGSIVTVSSNAAFGGDTSLGAYSAAKAGVNALTRSVATAYGKDGIRVNCVAPGSILSPSMVRNVPADVVDVLRDNCLLPRMGTPDDIADAVLFLVSDESSFITGQVLRVDGGTLSQLPHVPQMRRRGLVTNRATKGDGS